MSGNYFVAKQEKSPVIKSKDFKQIFKAEMAVIAWVLEVKEPLKIMKEKLINLGAVPGKPFLVDYLNYKPTNIKHGTTPVGLLHHSNYPFTSFVVGTSFPEGKIIHMVADRGMDFILPKLKAGLTPEHNASFECSGMEYTYEDYTIRLGVASMANSTAKGTIMEIEFCPPLYDIICIASMIKFTNKLLKKGEEQYPTYIEQRLQRYGTIDTLQQYKDIFTEMRRRTTTAAIETSSS